VLPVSKSYQPEDQINSPENTCRSQPLYIRLVKKCNSFPIFSYIIYFTDISFNAGTHQQSGFFTISSNESKKILLLRQS